MSDQIPGGDPDAFDPDPEAHGNLYDEVTSPPPWMSMEAQIEFEPFMPTSEDVVPLIVEHEG